MKLAFHRRRQFLALCSAGLLLAGWWWLRLPRYEGRSLAYWFNEFHQTDQGRRQPRGRHVQRALQALGTNAVPYVLEQAFTEDWAFRSWKAAIARFPKLESAAPKPFRDYLDDRKFRRDFLADDAVMWLWQLHPPASLVLPTLTNELGDSHPPNRHRAVEILGGLDATELPYLRTAFASRSGPVREAAFWALANLGTNAIGEVPNLVALDDPLGEVPIRFWYRIGPPARAILPRLRQRWLAETNFEALAAIIQIGDEAWAREAFHQSLQPQADHQPRLKALHFLAWASLPSMNARFLRPDLLQAANDEEAVVRFHALAAIGRLNLDPAPLKPWLEAKLQEPLPAKNNTNASWNEWHERLWASDLLLRMDPANAVALAFMADRLNDFEAWQAVDILARLENPGPPVLDLLERATHHRDAPVRELANEALAEFR